MKKCFLWNICSIMQSAQCLLTESAVSKSFQVLNDILCQLRSLWLTVGKSRLRKPSSHDTTSGPNSSGPLLTHTNTASPGKKKKISLLLGKSLGLREGCCWQACPHQYHTEVTPMLLSQTWHFEVIHPCNTPWQEKASSGIKGFHTAVTRSCTQAGK